MKKGGVSNVNGFIAFSGGPSVSKNKKSDIKTRKDVNNLQSSSLNSSKLAADVKTNKTTPSTTSNKSTPLIKNERDKSERNQTSLGSQGSTRKFVHDNTSVSRRELDVKKKSVGALSLKEKTLSSVGKGEDLQLKSVNRVTSRTGKPKRKESINDGNIKVKKTINSILEDRREISSSKTTMNDVFKTKINSAKQRTPVEKTVNSSVPDNVNVNSSISKEAVLQNLKDDAVIVDTKLNLDKLSEDNDGYSAQNDNGDEEYTYEDDFEDYESDFESYSSGVSLSSSIDDVDKHLDCSQVELNSNVKLEEEKQTDSENYDLSIPSLQFSLSSGDNEQTPRKVSIAKIEAIKEALCKENDAVREAVIIGAAEENDDDDTENSEKFTVSNEMLNFHRKSLLNFSSAKKRQQHLKKFNRMKARGEKLLNMIKLDTVTYSLFEKKPVPYEVFMKSFARKNTVQVYTQTNEDNLDEEIQTDDIDVKTKWVQFPPSLTKHELDKISKLPQLIEGVGDDNIYNEQEILIMQKVQSNSRKFERFVKAASQIILACLEEESKLKNSNDDNIILTNNKDDLDFAESYAALNCSHNNSILRNFFVTNILFSSDDPNKILTVHSPQLIENTAFRCSSRSIICVWNVLILSNPSAVLVSYGIVTSTCFSCEDSSFVLAGHGDGILSVWDLSEKSPHQYIDLEEGEENELLIRSPAYTTAKLKATAHMTAIKGIQSLSQDPDYGKIHHGNSKPVLVCTVDEDGILIVWSISRSNRINESEYGFAPWSKLRIFISHYVDIRLYISKSVSADVKIHCMKAISEYCVYVGTNYGHVLQFSLYGGQKNFKLFSLQTNELAFVTCIEESFSNKKRFVVGYSNGCLQLYDADLKKPLMEFVINFDLKSCAIITVKWLPVSSNHIVVLDSFNRISVFDVTDTLNLLPLYVKTFSSDEICSLDVSKKFDDKFPYIALLFKTGWIQLHKIKMNSSLLSCD